MDVFRAPIHTEHISMVPAEEDRRPKTRSGYLVHEAYSCYEKALGEVGTAASGKALHFAADIVCSGGLDIWIRGAYSYAVQHIGLANPRIFVYMISYFRIRSCVHWNSDIMLCFRQQLVDMYVYYNTGLVL